MTHRLRSSAAHGARLLLLSYLAAACSVSHYTSGASLAVPGTAPVPHALVHLTGGVTVYELANVAVVADSVIGYSESTGARLAIPMSSVASVETRSVSPGRTIGLVAGIVAGTAVVLFGIVIYLIGHYNADF